MKKYFIIGFLLLFTTGLFAQSAGNSGLSFLKIGFGARNMALSDFGVVGNDDVTSLFYNPSNLAKFKSSQIVLTHNEWIQDVTSELLGASFELWGLPFAVGVNSTSIKDIPVRKVASDEPISYFNANYFYSSLSTGFYIADNISFGATVKYLYEGLLSDEATGWGFDIGASYYDVIPNLDFGVSLRNMGSMDVLRNEATELPVDLRAGFSYEYYMDFAGLYLNSLAGIQTYTAEDVMHMHIAAEVSDNEVFAVRLGYMTGYESKGLTFGAGLKWKFMNFDYAFAPFRYELGNSHIISVMFNL